MHPSGYTTGREGQTMHMSVDAKCMSWVMALDHILCIDGCLSEQCPIS